MPDIKIKKSILLLVCCVLLCSSIFLLPEKIHNYLTYIVSIAGFVLYLSDKKIKFDKFYILPFCLAILISTYVNCGVFHKYFYLAILYAFSLVAINYFIYLAIKTNKWRTVINVMLLTMFILCAITDFSMFLGISYRQRFYLVGDKFAVAYMHMFFITLLSTQKKVLKIVKILVCMGSIFICYYIDCSTGIVGTVFLTILLYVPLNEKIKELMFNWKTFLIVLAGAYAIFYFLTMIISIPQISNFLETVLNTDLTLTGRMYIYNALQELRELKPVFGSGYLNNAVAEYFGWGNAQNGIMKILIDYGYVGLISFIIMGCVTFGFKRKINREEVIKIYPFVALLFSYIVCSIVEITFGYFYFLTLAIIYSTTRISNTRV